MEIALLKVAVFLVCVGLSFVLSGMEAGVFALSRLRVRQQMRAGRSSARVLHGFLEHPENFLWTILMGNTLANFFILGAIVAWLYERFAAWPAWFVVTFVAAVFLFYMLCDLLPKMLFRQFPNRLCVMLAKPFQVIHLALRPLVGMVEGLTGLLLRWSGGKAFRGHLFGNREELRMVMQESAAAFTGEERAMITRVMDLQSLVVRQVDLPLEQAVTVNLGTPMREVFEICHERQLTRLPVWATQGDERRIVGVLELDTFIYRDDLPGERRAGDFVGPAVYLDEDLRLEIALQRMQRSGQRLGIVLGRDRREAGIISMEDILRVIFGQMKT